MRRKALWSAFVCVVVATASHAEWAEKKLVFSRNDTQEHLWLSAGGTFVGSYTLRWLRVRKVPAAVTAGFTVVGLGLAKEFGIDDNPSVNDFAADGLGALLGGLFAITVPLGAAAPERHLQPSAAPPLPAWGSRLSLYPLQFVRAG